jgi:hypothetical protein
MDQNLQGVLLYHNYQATMPYRPGFTPTLGTASAAQAVPAREEPPPAEPEPAPAEEENKQ